MQVFEQFKTYIKDKFNLKDEDYEKIKLLFLFSFAIGFFVAFYFVPANSKFLENYGHYELPYAYIVSGVVGVISISIYSLIQIRHRSKSMFLSAIFLMLLISFSTKIFYIILENNLFNLSFDKISLYKRFLSFFVFVWAWPFIALGATISGALAIRLFNLLQVKNFFGIINLGGVIAAIIAYASITEIVKLLPSQYDLILIGSIGLFLSIYILFFIYKKFPEKKLEREEKAAQTPKIHFLKVFKNRFVLFIFIGAIISSIIIYVTDYGFLITVKANRQVYFPSEQALAQYLTIIYALLKVGEFAISLFSGNILTKGGLKLGLIFMPIILTLIFALAFISAEVFGYGSIAFLFFITFAKTMERILRRGIDEPAFNVLYQTLPEDHKSIIQTRVGIAQQASIALAGVLLLIFNFIIKHYSQSLVVSVYPLFALPAFAVFVFMAYKLYLEYKQRIKDILAEKKLFKVEYTENETFAIDILMKHLLDRDLDNAKFSTVILSLTNPRSLETYAAFLLKVDDNIIRKAILSNIDSTYNEKLVPIIEIVGNKSNITDKELKKLFLQAFFKLDYSDVNQLSVTKVKTYALADNEDMNIIATKYLFKYPIPNEEPLVLHLLNSKSKTVKLAAIKIASRLNSQRLWKEIILMLDDPQYNNILINIMVEIGEPVLNLLNEYGKKQINTDIISKIIQIYAKIGTPKAQFLLLNFLNFPDREIQKLAIEALAYTQYKAVDEDFNLIKDKIRDVVFNIHWFLVAIKDLVHEKNTLKIVQALDLERINSLEQLFILLSFTNSPEIIELIKINIIGENTIFAIELIDNFIQPEIKKIIIPLFEPISISQKSKKLESFFVIEPVGFEKRLIEIVLTNNQFVDVWSQARAIELIDKLLLDQKIETFNKDLLKIKQPIFWDQSTIELIKIYVDNPSFGQILWVSLLHPSELVFTTALKILYERDCPQIEEFISNLTAQKIKIFNDLKNKQNLITENLKLLKRVFLFYSVAEKSLLKLSKIIENLNLKAEDSIELFDNSKEFVIIINKGELESNLSNNIQKFGKNSILIRGLNLPQKVTSLKAKSNSNILRIERFQFFNLLISNNELINNLFKTMKF